jgi:hypothetical protein
VDVEVKLQTLEAELKILKNEMHEVLLEIQEQILLHYYPSLRPEEKEPSDAVLQALEAIQEKKQAKLQVSDRGDVDAETDETAESAGGEVSSMQTGADSTSAAPETSREQRPFLMSGPVRVPPFHGDDMPSINGDEQQWKSFVEMVEWVEGSLEVMGAERTRKVISLLAEEGQLSESMLNTLHRIVALAEKRQ